MKWQMCGKGQRRGKERGVGRGESVIRHNKECKKCRGESRNLPQSWTGGLSAIKIQSCVRVSANTGTRLTTETGGVREREKEIFIDLSYQYLLGERADNCVKRVAA